jgi:hypothetical protein
MEGVKVDKCRMEADGNDPIQMLRVRLAAKKAYYSERDYQYEVAKSKSR